MRCRRLIFTISMIFFLVFWSTPALATQDTGAITVTGSIPPPASSVSTTLNLQNSSATVAQGQELTYIISYSSSNATGMPLTFQAEWEKGQIQGATEPSVEALEYVVGSAGQAFGGSEPVIDSLQKRITWQISNLPPGSGTQTVSFKLRTTSSYTGSLPVTLRTKLHVLSPVGVSDRLQETTYVYESTSVGVPSVSPSPVVPTSPANLQPQFENIAIRSVGKETARVAIALTSPTTLAIRYGSDVAQLTTQLDSSTSAENHIFTLQNLLPKTTYYFQVFNRTDPDLVSDIFSLSTAESVADESTPRPIGINISHERSLLFSGPTTTENGAETPPVPVTQNGVLDLSLALSKPEEVVSIDVLVRLENVLGSSTQPSDAFQSSSTRMTKISPSVFVGKIKVPPDSGNYILVAYVEDIYGNLTESELGKVVAVKPLRIRDQKTGQPIVDAKVELFIFNQQTKLFEVISNVSTAIANPSYSDEEGIVTTNFPAARYLAIITAPGYQEARVEFEIGENQVYDFPQVQLTTTSNVLIRQYQFSSTLFNREWLQWMKQFERLAKLDTLFRPLLLIQVILLMLLLTINYFYQRIMMRLQQRQVSPFKQVGRLVVIHILRFWFEFYLFINVVFSYYFWQEGVKATTLVFTLLAIINMCLWLRFIWLRYTFIKLNTLSSLVKK